MAEPNPVARNLRLVILFVVLAVMLFALWYDHKVARPRVERAWQDVNALNDEINRSSGSRVTTNTDVQKTLGRQPSSVLTNHPPYVVEVYNWMAGLPFRSHKYYAVYSRVGNDLRFVTHFMYELPPAELEPHGGGRSSEALARSTGPAEEAPKEPPKKGRSKRPSGGDRPKEKAEKAAAQAGSSESGPPVASEAADEKSSDAAQPESPPSGEAKAASESEPTPDEEQPAAKPEAETASPSPPDTAESTQPAAAEPDAAKPAP